MVNRMNDLISVIIPVYNVDNSILDKCINSIISQKYRNLEIIMIDDGSRKETADECDRLSKMDSRIKLIHQENKGISGATNVGINIAKGKYIGFSDCDDYMDAEMFEILYNNLIKYDVDISMAGYNTVYPNGDVKLRDYFKDDVLLSRDEALKELLDNKKITSVVWNKLFRRELWDNIRFSEGMWFEDCAVMHKLFFAARRGVYCSHKRLYNYYQRNDSVMNSHAYVNVIREIEAWENRLSFLEENMPELSVKAKEKILKLAIKGMLNPDYQKDISLEDYISESKKLIGILENNETEALIGLMPKYQKDYKFLKKYKYSKLAKKIYRIKKRIFK